MVCSNIGGRIMGWIKLPPLIGMLLAGLMFRNLPFLSFYEDIPVKWALALRNASLVVIFLRGGLGLDPHVLKKLKFVCLRLAVIPCLMEALTTSVVCHRLFSFPWSLCFCLGFVVTGLSPAVIVPIMLMLEKQGYGRENGITTLIIAASSLDDVLAIAGIGISVGFAFSKGSLAWTIVKGPLEVLLGLIYGSILGIFCWYFPSSSDDLKIFYRIILLTFGGLAANYMGLALDFAAAGALGSLSLAFVAALKWRKEPDKNLQVVDFENELWIFLQTFLFGLIGAEVSIADLKRDIGPGLLIILVAVLCRAIVTYIVLFKSQFNLKERMFILLAWIPKATIQAAMGSVALDFARTLNLGADYIMYGKQILMVAVLAILLTAPIGAVGITICTPWLLEKSEQLLPVTENKSTDCYGSCENHVKSDN